MTARRPRSEPATSSCRAARCIGGTIRSPSPAAYSARSLERGGRSERRKHGRRSATSHLNHMVQRTQTQFNTRRNFLGSREFHLQEVRRNSSRPNDLHFYRDFGICFLSSSPECRELGRRR